MRYSTYLLQALFFAVLLPLACGDDSDNSSSESSATPKVQPSWLFTQSATAGSLVFHEDKKDSSKDFDATITLHGVQKVVGFTDRPNRLTHYIENSDFVSYWDEKYDDNFTENPPNAVLHVTIGTDNVQIIDYSLELATGSYLYTDLMNTMIYNLKADGELSLKELWEKLKDNDNCSSTQKDEKGNVYTLRSCSLNHPALFIDSWFSDAVSTVSHTVTHVYHAAKKTVTKSADAVTHVVKDTGNAVASAGCITLTTAAIMTALAGSGEGESFDAAIAATSFMTKAAKGAAITAACTALGSSIELANSNFPKTDFSKCCGTLVRGAISPTGAVVHGASVVICEIAQGKSIIRSWSDVCK